MNSTNNFAQFFSDPREQSYESVETGILEFWIFSLEKIYIPIYFGFTLLNKEFFLIIGFHNK